MIDALRVEPVVGERREYLGGMPGAAGLDRDVDRHALGGHVEEQAAMRDLKDVRAERAEPGRDAAEQARPVVGR